MKHQSSAPTDTRAKVIDPLGPGSAWPLPVSLLSETLYRLLSPEGPNQGSSVVVVGGRRVAGGRVADWGISRP